MKRIFTVLLILVLAAISIPGALAENGWQTMTVEKQEGKSEWDIGAYEGNVQGGKRHGFGMMAYENGGKFYGMFADDLRSGFGIIVAPEGDNYHLYAGNFTRNSEAGYAVMSWVGGSRNKGTLTSKKWNPGVEMLKFEYEFVRDYVSSEGSTYTGEVMPGTLLRDGYGVLVWSGGEIYVGEFVSNQLSGYGIYLNKDKSISYGIWEKGELVENLRWLDWMKRNGWLE